MNKDQVVQGMRRLISRSQESRDLVVFDLDSTLYDVSGRTQQILWDFAALPEVVKAYPEESQVIASMRVLQTDWGIKEALIRSNLKANLAFFEKVRLYWIEHFFDSSYLHKDKPYPGSVEFVNTIYEAGIPIAYLTGRGKAKMKSGTLTSLESNGFPLPFADKVRLIMKNDNGKSDEFFKRDELSVLSKKYDEVWLFENEPIIINVLAQDLPEIKVVYFKSIHSGRGMEPEETLCLGTEFPDLRAGR